MRKRISLLFLFAATVGSFGLFTYESEAQRRLGPFSHNTRAHKEGKYNDCASCHTLPTKNWQARSLFPDVATYPYHTSCFGCHTRDIYTNSAVFCGTCHTEPSMRARGGAGVLRFPGKGHARQFNTIFPHDLHQDLIAASPPVLPRNAAPNTDYAVAHFVKASFSLRGNEPVRSSSNPQFYNCAICHSTSNQIPKNLTRKIADLKPLSDLVPDTFERPMTAAFFKKSPTGHESCFTCHYQYQNLPAGKQNCAGCHQLTAPYFEKKATERYSLKFDHDRAGHGDKDCISCHVRITQQSNVALMKDADVPIASCWSCHATNEQDRSRRILFAEIESREKQATFQCTYCHTSAIGRFEIPTSHRKP